MNNRRHLLFVLMMSTLVVHKINAHALKNDTSRQRQILVLSGGTQAGFWSLMGLKPASLSFNADLMNTKSGISIGMGWTHDHYKSGPTGNLRENLRIRMCDFFGSPDHGNYHFVGGAIGLSYWRSETNRKYNLELFETVFPTLQIIYGFGIGLPGNLSWHNEIALGPPYAIRTAVALTIK